MKEKVNYEDDLFYVSTMIKSIKKSLALNISLAFFAERQNEDLIFIHHSIQNIYRELSDNNFLINRNSYLHNLLKVKMHFTALLDIYLSPEHQERHNNELHSQLRSIKEKQESDQRDIRHILCAQEETVESDLISMEELNFLMAPGLQDED